MVLADSNAKNYIMAGILIILGIGLAFVKFNDTNRIAGTIAIVALLAIGILIILLSKKIITTINKPAGTILIENRSLIQSKSDSYPVSEVREMVIYEISTFDSVNSTKNGTAIPLPRISYQLRIVFKNGSYAALEKFTNSNRTSTTLFGLPIILSDHSYKNELAITKTIADFLDVPVSENGFAASINSFLN